MRFSRRRPEYDEDRNESDQKAFHVRAPKGPSDTFQHPPCRSSSRSLTGIETLGLIVDTFKLEGSFWEMIGSLNDNFSVFGYGIIGIFALSWLVSVLVYRERKATTRRMSRRAPNARWRISLGGLSPTEVAGLR